MCDLPAGALPDAAPRDPADAASPDEARRRPMDAVPPVEEWGDAARVAAARDAMQHVDHEPGAWFLVTARGELFLEARYVVSSVVDDVALVRLTAAEVAAYRDRGRDHLSDLARHLHDHGPHREDSPFRERDLYRGPDARGLRDEVAAAIADHTWLGAQRQRR